jgi:hypothetical protein
MPAMACDSSGFYLPIWIIGLHPRFDGKSTRTMLFPRGLSRSSFAEDQNDEPLPIEFCLLYLIQSVCWRLPSAGYGMTPMDTLVKTTFFTRRWGREGEADVYRPEGAGLGQWWFIHGSVIVGSRSQVPADSGVVYS